MDKYPQPKTSADSPALTLQRAGYPPAWGGKVPKRVRIIKTVMPDFSLNFVYKDLVAQRDAEYEVWVNSYGGSVAIIGGEMLGLKPGEFEVIEWHETAVKPLVER